MSMKSGASADYESGSWLEAIHDVYVGATVGAAHNLFFFKKYVQELLGASSSADDIEALTQRPVGSLRVIGVGYGRTGTYSLTLALTELGFPTLHTMHLYENEDILNMWANQIFKPSLENKHAELGHPDFDVITRHGYQGTADLPMALYFEQIHAKYPDCKFVLTTRESSEVWFKSWDTLTKSITGPTNFGGKFISGVKNYSVYLRWLFALVNKDDTFLTSTEPQMIQNKEQAIASYEQHNARVREVIPASQLLEYNVRQGWQPLCDFLEISPADCPTDRPFPKTNSARSVQSQAFSAAMTPLVCVAICLLFLLHRAFCRTNRRSAAAQIHDNQAPLLPMFLRSKAINMRHEKTCVPDLIPSSGSSVGSDKEC